MFSPPQQPFDVGEEGISFESLHTEWELFCGDLTSPKLEHHPFTNILARIARTIVVTTIPVEASFSLIRWMETMISLIWLKTGFNITTSLKHGIPRNKLWRRLFLTVTSHPDSHLTQSGIVPMEDKLRVSRVSLETVEKKRMPRRSHILVGRSSSSFAHPRCSLSLVPRRSLILVVRSSSFLLHLCGFLLFAVRCIF
ncbi:hypothetical protein BLNAU_4537 [Blattamonas nauphoetae]|uniref:HAT C-terminal dimerisation domain-containing protein n=1 Tax=Blattamonas nauphoetae TaxID=2049346 RepID=A0ABQ9Y9E6_9EUKA|nr:hypothetical protein BLNAU_4537 [Blattamonas nauphoetae]